MGAEVVLSASHLVQLVRQHPRAIPRSPLSRVLLQATRDELVKFVAWWRGARGLDVGSNGWWGLANRLDQHLQQQRVDTA